MVVRHFIVHFAYVHVAEKLLHMCSMRKIFHASGFVCSSCLYVCRRTCADTGVFYVVMLKWPAIKTKVIL